MLGRSLNFPRLNYSDESTAYYWECACVGTVLQWSIDHRSTVFCYVNMTCYKTGSICCLQSSWISVRIIFRNATALLESWYAIHLFLNCVIYTEESTEIKICRNRKPQILMHYIWYKVLFVKCYNKNLLSEDHPSFVI